MSCTDVKERGICFSHKKVVGADFVEDRLRLGKIKINFVFRSTCTIFAGSFFISMATTGDIIIKGARVNNLKNIDVTIPRRQVSRSHDGPVGLRKSSLTLDTLYAEGQRRYVGAAVIVMPASSWGG